MSKRISPNLDEEIARLQAEYRRVDSGTSVRDRYGLFQAAALLQSQSLERHVLSLLKRRGRTDLAEMRILDVGCGRGGTLQNMLRYGARPEHVSGIDLLPWRIDEARQRHPGIDWRVGSAHELPYPDASFDLVLGFVLFSSLLDEALRRQIAAEMWRVRSPGGLLLIYDFAYSNPRNPAVRGITRRTIRQLFNHPGASFDFQRLTLAPPLARLIAPRTSTLAYLLERLTIFNTHSICTIAPTMTRFSLSSST